MTGNGTLFTLEHFVSVVPQLDSALIERIYKLVFQKDELTFEEFVKALHNVLHARPKRARLGLIFMLLVGDRMGELSRDLSLEVVATHLQVSSNELCLFIHAQFSHKVFSAIHGVR